MWKQLCRIQLRPHNVRTFLSDAYKCTAEWQARLDTPVLQQIKLDTFFYELDRKFQTHGKICAIDLDIFANKINDSSHLEELTDLVHRLRLTEETSNALDSTSHAVIRHYLDFGTKTIEDLVKILDDRLGYGVFFDTYTANLLLDHFLKAKNYRLAAHMATLLMLQEDFSNDISRTLSLYSCYKFVQNPVPFEEPIKVEPVAVAEEEKPKAKTAKGKKKTEELRVRVRFIRNEYFDDHFDIKNSEHLVGKTLIAISRQTEGTLANSVALIGSCFYQKYEEGLKFLETIAKTNDIHNEAVEIVKNHLTKVSAWGAHVIMSFNYNFGEKVKRSHSHYYFNFFRQKESPMATNLLRNFQLKFKSYQSRRIL